jgi:hypothetical protein
MKNSFQKVLSYVTLRFDNSNFAAKMKNES